MLRILGAFLKRDFLLYFNYRFAILSNIFTVLTYATTFYFISLLFDGNVSGHFAAFGGNYFSYVLVGIAVSNFVGGALGNLSNNLRQEQLMGTLEAMLTTPISTAHILVAMNFWNLLLAFLDMLIYIVAGIFIFRVSFVHVDWISFLTVFLLTIISFTSLGTITASMTLAFKRGGGVAGTINVFSDLLGGVYFPVTVLPWFFQGLAFLLPTTYAIRAINKAVYNHASLAELRTEIFALALFASILLCISLLFFQFALKQARRYGNLSHY